MKALKRDEPPPRFMVRVLDVHVPFVVLGAQQLLLFQVGSVQHPEPFRFQVRAASILRVLKNDDQAA